MNVPSGKSTYITWALIVLAVAAAVVKGVQDGLEWESVALAGIGAAMAIIYRITAATQANHLVDNVPHEPVVTDAIGIQMEPTTFFVPDEV